MGDLQAELVTELSDARFRDISTDSLFYRGIRVRVGGTAANFALAAADFFSTVNVLGALGDDTLGRTVRDDLAKRGINIVGMPTAQAPTGVSIYVRDASADASDGVRLLIVDRGANLLLNVAAVEDQCALITKSDLLYCDGYCMRDEPRRSAALRAMTMARAHGVAVAFDLVPHKAHLLYRLDDLKEWARSIDILFVEARTIRAMLGLPWQEEIRDRDLVHRTWRMLEETLPGMFFYIQFGVGNVDESLYGRAGQVPEWRLNGYVGTAEPRGFGDRLAAADLAAHVGMIEGPNRRDKP